jgi:hypothetical protein
LISRFDNETTDLVLDINLRFRFVGTFNSEQLVELNSEGRIGDMKMLSSAENILVASDVEDVPYIVIVRVEGHHIYRFEDIIDHCICKLPKKVDLPQTKECPKCLKGTMELQVEVEGDEAHVGDPDSGDYEMGQTRTVFYECNNKCCKFTEVVNQEFKGSGILR